MLQDIRYALRGFARSPGFVATVVVTIGLALGLNTTMFTIFNAYVLRPFDVRDPYGLFNLAWTTKSGRKPLTFREFERLRAGTRALEGTMVTDNLLATIEGQPLIGQRVTADYFSLLGVRAAMGRTISDQTAPEMILSYGAWTAKFDADPNILGRSFAVMGRPYTVIGVARHGFEGVSAAAIDFWIPMGAQPPPLLQSVVVRLRPALPVSQAQAELDVLARAVTSDRPPDQQAIGVELRSNATPLSLAKSANYILFGPTFTAFGLVLLIACANVTNMLLARATARQKEMGVRLALGAGRARIIRQLLVESILLALPAALAGFLVARISLRTAMQLYFAHAPSMVGRLVRILPLDLDARVFGFLIGAAFLATLLFGLAPALQAARGDIAAATRGEIAGVRPSRLRGALVVSQIAVCVLLLIVAGILLTGSTAMYRHDPGVVTRNVVDIELISASSAHIVEQVRMEPWADATAIAAHAVMTGFPTIAIGPLNAATVRSGYNFVSPEYFDLLRIPMVRGRMFTRDEATAEAAVAVISQATAHQFWPNSDPIGQTVRIEPQPLVDRSEVPRFRRAQIVGIVADVISGDITDGIDPTMFYFPTGPRGANSRTIVVRMKEDTEASRRSLNETVERLAPGGSRMAFSLDEMRAVQVFPFQLSFAIAAFLGGLALVLAISGIYGVLSYLVAQRRREIGIRMALGASSRSVVGLILAQSTRFAIWGIAIGTLSALAISRSLASILEGVNTYEPLAYAGGILSVMAAALAASYVPSLRAARVDPSSTLRCD